MEVGRRKLRGERCDECGTKIWWLEHGRKFCDNGHEDPDFIELDHGDREDLGPLGRRVTKQKEARVVEKRHLTGAAGKLLYLEALQLILRYQVTWLINEKKYPVELETVVRDLWDVRVRGAASLDARQEKAMDEGELEMFSSQTPGSEDEAKRSKLRSNYRAENWDGDRTNWPLPKMHQTLALCYLGCLLLRIPTRLGEFVLWLHQGAFPYKRAYFLLPQEMRDRMPSAYTRVLKLPSVQDVTGEEIYDAVANLAFSYHTNCNKMEFPPINQTALLIDYAKALAVPVEPVMFARKISSILKPSLTFPLGKSKVFPLDHPEVVPIALMVVAIKMCFPLDPSLAASAVGALPSLPTLDWEMWQQGLTDSIDDHEKLRRQSDFAKVTADEVVAMTEEKLEAYIAHVMSTTEERDDHLEEFFPTPAAVESSDAGIPRLTPERKERSAEMLRQAFQEPDNEEMTQKSFGYEAFPSLEALDGSDAAKALYTVAANASGLSIETVVRATYTLEQALLKAQKGL